jgi:RND superfamily putative drug exporter
MVAVFAIFATPSTLDIKQIGVGLAVAVLLDATLIRGVLLRAAMKLLRLTVEPELREETPRPVPSPAA